MFKQKVKVSVVVQKNETTEANIFLGQTTTIYISCNKFYYGIMGIDIVKVLNICVKFNISF